MVESKIAERHIAELGRLMRSVNGIAARIAGLLVLIFALGTVVQPALALAELTAATDEFGPQVPPSSATANELVRQTIENELNQHSDSQYMFREWRKTPEGSKTKEVIETQDGSVARLVAINDKPLTPEEAQTEDTRLKNLLAHPEIQQQKKKEQQQDDERVRKMFKELPKAFLYQELPSDSKDLVHLSFQPNPKYEPSSHETAVFKSMSGQMWINEKEKRLARIEGTLFKDVNFGWGLLGHLDKGGHFTVQQSKIGPDRWDVTDMDVWFTGKALLFKTINERELEKMTDFRRVPNRLTLAQGIDLLNGSPTDSSAKGR
jgi:hypothetical protein